MKNWNTIFIFLISAGIIYACQNGAPSRVADSTSHDHGTAHDSSYGNIASEKKLSDSILHYSGVLPCADCESVETSLALAADFTYTQRLLYYGRKSKGPGSNEYTDSGRWMKHADILHLLNANGSSTYYKQTDTALLQVDEKGERLGGKLADKFVLRKQ